MYVQKCEEFACDILSNCESMKDVETLLEHSSRKNDNEMRSYSEKNWNLALHNDQKNFVSHPFYQQHLWRKLNGNHIKWDTCPWYWRVALVFLFILFYFFVFPFIVLFDILSCNNDILFESPEQLKRHQHEISCSGKERKVKAFCRGLIHTPIFRIVIHHFLEAFFLVCVFLTTIDPLDVYNEKKMQWYDGLLGMFVTLYLLGDIVELVRARSRFRSFWLIYNFATSLLMMMGGITTAIAFHCMEDDDDDRARLSGNAVPNVGTTIFAFAAPLAMLRPLRWFLFSKTLGTTIVCTIKVMVNVFQAFLIYIIIFAANAAGLFCMFKPFYIRKVMSSHQTLEPSDYQMEKPDLATKYGWLKAMFWRLFDPGQPDYATVLKCDGGNCPETGDNVSLEFSHSMGLVMWALFQGVTTIVLLNLLIALMNSTYTRVWSQSDTIWKHSKSLYQVKFLDSRTSMPPPFK